MFATQNGNLEIVKLLLNNHAPVDLTSFDGGTALHCCCQVNDRTEIINCLLEHGANTNLQISDGATPLFMCSQNSNIDISKILIKFGANVNLCRNDQCSPLWIATQFGHADMVAFLIQNGSEVDAARKDGSTPLFKAAAAGDCVIAQILLNANASVLLLKNGHTALMAAVNYGHMDMVKLLCDYGSDPNMLNLHGFRCIHFSEYNGHDEISRYLHIRAKYVIKCQSSHLNVPND
ncbi:Ankyrin repeat domain-containing protein 29 [Intoshia linei]|uniref:Ankyrin repeat domain-containing protein 29 n=1 Tax=Intoshia linei TaxID=1819745 RepID=A0A177ASK6_9BILA|nr:Ankyrin repeat domain-containing protein 29 [Intoshia linei]